MDVKQAYNIWADQYDTNRNKTRDLEAVSLKETLANYRFDNCLEIGSGTGKNTPWLLTKAKHITAVDLSHKMLTKAKEKINTDRVTFHQFDITEEWTFATRKYDLVTFSLILEHIEDIDSILRKAASAVNPNGYVYIGELHPFKQYAGTKARFKTEQGEQVVNCFTHNISDFTRSAKQNGFEIMEINEYFDNNDRTNIPRIFTLLLRKEGKNQTLQSANI